MSTSEERPERTTRPGETAQPPAGFLPSMRHYLSNRTARLLVLIAVVVVVVLAVVLVLAVGSTSEDEPGPGASGPGPATVHLISPGRPL